MQAAQRRWKRQGNGFCSGALDSRPPALWENDCVLSATRLTAVSDNSPRNRHGLCPVEAQVTEQGGGGEARGWGPERRRGRPSRAEVARSGVKEASWGQEGADRTPCGEGAAGWPQGSWAPLSPEPPLGWPHCHPEGRPGSAPWDSQLQQVPRPLQK